MPNTPAVSVRRRAPERLPVTILFSSLQFQKSLPSQDQQSQRIYKWWFNSSTNRGSSIRRHIRSYRYCRKMTALERDEFRKIPAYLEVLKKEDPSGHFILKTDSVTERFQRLFISPSACRKIFRSCPRIVACDGTFTKSKFRQTLLFAVTIDGNDEVVLAWALVESENEDTWSFFLKEQKWYVPLFMFG